MRVPTKKNTLTLGMDIGGKKDAEVGPDARVWAVCKDRGQETGHYEDILREDDQTTVREEHWQLR